MAKKKEVNQEVIQAIPEFPDCSDMTPKEVLKQYYRL